MGQLHVGDTSWVFKSQELKAAGYVRCEWLTATHNGDANFDITLCVSTQDLAKKTLVSTSIVESVDSLIAVYPSIAFHEREVAQMFGVNFAGHDTSQLAFETKFAGFPLRRDFALETRAQTSWPGAVDPEISARRRQPLPPGVIETWKS